MIVLSFPPPTKAMNANDREHWRPKAARTKLWRQAARIAALDAINRGAIERNQPFSIVQISLPVKSLNVRRDATNMQPTQKACLDGIVQAGIFADDDGLHVAEISPRFHLQSDDPHVSILIRPARAAGVL